MLGKASVARFFDEYASGFDAIYGTRNTPLNRLVNRYLRKSMRLRFDRSIAGCQPLAGRSVVDVGCGPGHFAVTLAEQGAGQVLGLDFAEGMIAIARERARTAGVHERCQFELCDFTKYQPTQSFDYSIVMGFMDYIKDPRGVVDKVRGMTTRRAMFSFPAEQGFLAFQRRVRYKFKCDLYMYNHAKLVRLFEGHRGVIIEQLARDYFVTIECDVASASRDSRAKKL